MGPLSSKASHSAPGLPRIAIGLLATLPLASCENHGSTPAPVENSKSVERASGLIARLAPLLPSGLALDDTVTGAPHLASLRSQLASLRGGGMDSVPGFLRTGVESIIDAVLQRDSEEHDLLHELGIILRPLDRDGDGIVSQAELQSDVKVCLPPRWHTFITEYGSALNRYISLGTLAGWHMRD